MAAGYNVVLGSVALAVLDPRSVVLENASLNTGGGSVEIRGGGPTGFAGSSGVSIVGSTINAGAGITINGIGTAGAPGATAGAPGAPGGAGVEVSGSSPETASGDINITGVGGAGGAGALGLLSAVSVPGGSGGAGGPGVSLSLAPGPTMLVQAQGGSVQVRGFGGDGGRGARTNRWSSGGFGGSGGDGISTYGASIIGTTGSVTLNGTGGEAAPAGFDNGTGVALGPGSTSTRPFQRSRVTY